MIEIISQIIVYKFTNLSRQEVDAMLETRLEDTRVYRELRDEIIQEIARALLKKNVDLETIIDVTGLSLAQVQQLQADNS